MASHSYRFKPSRFRVLIQTAGLLHNAILNLHAPSRYFTSTSHTEKTHSQHNSPHQLTFTIPNALHHQNQGQQAASSAPMPHPFYFPRGHRISRNGEFSSPMTQAHAKPCPAIALFFSQNNLAHPHAPLIRRREEKIFSFEGVIVEFRRGNK